METARLGERLAAEFPDDERAEPARPRCARPAAAAASISRRSADRPPQGSHDLVKAAGGGKPDVRRRRVRRLRLVGFRSLIWSRLRSVPLRSRLGWSQAAPLAGLPGSWDLHRTRRHRSRRRRDALGLFGRRVEEVEPRSAIQQVVDMNHDRAVADQRDRIGRRFVAAGNAVTRLFVEVQGDLMIKRPLSGKRDALPGAMNGAVNMAEEDMTNVAMPLQKAGKVVPTRQPQMV